MSLLMMDQTPEFQRLTNEIFNRQLENDRRLQEELDSRAKQKMYQDVQYNVDFLYAALQLDDDGIFTGYARWIYQLLCPLMSYFTRERVRDIMTDHYELIRTCMEQTIPESQKNRLNHLLDCAIQATADECGRGTARPEETGKYEAETKRYLDLLLHSDTRGAMNLITKYVKDGIPVEDICADIVAEAMRTVGELWHGNQISVDMEHYCTSITQMALSQLYPLIFGQVRIGKNILVACVGSELHEMGARMVADLFEYHGWDSIYLGAAVPADALEDAVGEHKPALVALSVTMPQHLPLCKEAVSRLREKYPQVKIAVGGNAFVGTRVWESWGADVCTGDARELIKWADGNL